MLRWALIFLVIAIVAAILPGFAVVEGVAANIAWFLAVAFLILFVVSLIVGRGASPPV
ncbi:hypothetical protein BH23PLA1_BH23PLA1_09840 [soil metagenome]